VIESLAADLSGEGVDVTPDASVAELTTYRIGGPVALLARVGTERELLAVAEAVQVHRPRVLVVGRGSNLLVADSGFAGLAVVLGGQFEGIEVGEATVRAGGAVALPVLARRAAAAGRAGLEFFVGIPGSVGGAVRMNAGGHGRETADVLVNARVLDLDGGGWRELGVADLDLGYRCSSIGPRAVVVRADFTVGLDDPAACEGRIVDVVRWRRDHQPGGANAGSVFRNPEGDSAGRLIDAAGLRGLRVGGAAVSEKHANFFQAEPGASATDVRDLVLEVRRRVADRFAVELVPELEMIGFE